MAKYRLHYIVINSSHIAHFVGANTCMRGMNSNVLPLRTDFGTCEEIARVLPLSNS